MFPLNFNSLFRKSNGELTTLGKMFDNAGGSYSLPTASASTKGGVKVGSGLTMDGETLNNDNPTPYTLPTASASTKGGVKVGSGLTMDGETLNNDNPTPYTLPTASASTKGGVKIGSGLTMDGETLNNDNPTPYDDSGILASISAINDNLNGTVLWEGDTNYTSPYTINLNESYQNYKKLLFFLKVDAYGGRCIIREVSCEQIDQIRTEGTNDVTVPMCWGYADKNDFFDIRSNSTNTRLETGSTLTKCTKIIGLKHY